MTSKSPSLVALASLLSLTGSLALACGDDEKDDNGTSSGGSAGRGGAGEEGGAAGEAGGSPKGGSAGEAPSSAGGASGASAGEAGSGGAAGAGGQVAVTDGSRFVGGILRLTLERCACLIDDGAYADEYECFADDGFPVFSEHTVACVDELATESDIAASYVGCVADVYEGLGDCAEARGDECAPVLGSDMACPEGGIGTRCDSVDDCMDGSDESSCPTDFACEGGGTVVPAAVCNGFEQCADGSDEDDCEGKVPCHQVGNLEALCGTPPDAVENRFNVCLTL